MTKLKVSALRCAAMVYTHYAKTRILYHRKRGLKPYSIQKKLEKENIKTTSGGIANFLKHYSETQSLKRKPGSGRVPKLAKEVKQVVKEHVERNVKISTQELSELLVSKGYDFSEKSVERYRALLARGCSDSSRHSDSASTASNEDVILVEVEEPPANPTPITPQMNSIPQLSAPSSRHTNDVTINSHITESGESLSHSHTHNHTFSHSRTHNHTFSLTRTHNLSLSLSLPFRPPALYVCLSCTMVVHSDQSDCSVGGV